MTIEELHREISPVLKDMDRKLDDLSEKVVKHEVNIAAVNRENRDMKSDQKRIDDRVSKIERWMWWTLGAGSAAGVGISKLFL